MQKELVIGQSRFTEILDHVLQELGLERRLVSEIKRNSKARSLESIYQNLMIYRLGQWFSNFLHQVPPQKIFGFPSTTIMTNIKMQYEWLPTAPGVFTVCVCVCVCVCVFTAPGVCLRCVCVCVHFGWVKCRAQIPSMSRHFHFQ